MYLILAMNIDFNGITLPCAIKTRNREQDFVEDERAVLRHLYYTSID